MSSLTMGMDDASTTKGDFYGMDSIRDLFIGGIYLKAFISGDEQDTKAAAAAGAVIQSKALQP